MHLIPYLSKNGLKNLGRIKLNSILTVEHSSVRPKPLFWFRSDTETETQIG